MTNPLPSTRGLVLTLCIAVLGSVVLSTNAAAQASDPATTAQERRVDQRQARQAGRIASASARGELTPREQARLQHQQAATARMEQRIEADGRVTPREAARIEQRQDRNSRAIRRQAHDAQRPG